LDALEEAARRRGDPAPAEPIIRRAWDIARHYPPDHHRSRIAQRYEVLLRQIGRGAEVDERLGIRREPGVIEGEDLAVRSKTSGEAGRQPTRDWGDQWSGAYQLGWGHQARGATLILELPAGAGRYDVMARFTKAPNYGIAELSIDREKLAAINLFQDRVIPSDPEHLGSVELDDGRHVLTIRMIDADPRSTGSRYGFGLDWIRLTPTGPGPAR
jgi:hypothetical protein